MLNPYAHFLKLELNEEDLKQLEDAYYGKKPQTMGSPFLELELNDEDLKQLEDAFYSKDSQETTSFFNLGHSVGDEQQKYRKASQEIEVEDSLKKRKRELAKNQEDNNHPPLKQKSYWLPVDHKKRMTENMFKLKQTADNQLCLKAKKETPPWAEHSFKFELKKDNQRFEKEESQPAKDEKIIFVSHQEQARKRRPQKTGPQHRFMFHLNTNTGKLIEPQKEEQDQPSFTGGKP